MAGEFTLTISNAKDFQSSSR